MFPVNIHLNPCQYKPYPQDSAAYLTDFHAFRLIFSIRTLSYCILKGLLFMLKNSALILLFCSLIPLTGCRSLIREDDRPVPTEPPYAVSPAETEKIYSETDAVNAAVSAVSLRLAVSGSGPFQVRPVNGRTTPPGLQVIRALYNMKQAQNQAPYILNWEDSRVEPGLWRIRLTLKDRIFFEKTLKIKAEQHDK